MPKPDPQPLCYGTCEVCGRHDRHIEHLGPHWVCVDYLGCLATGLNTAVALGRAQRASQLEFAWEVEDG